MSKYQVNDKVMIISADEAGKHLIGKMGVVVPIGGFGYSPDDVNVKLDDGAMVQVKQAQLVKVADMERGKRQAAS